MSTRESLKAVSGVVPESVMPEPTNMCNHNERALEEIMHTISPEYCYAPVS